MANTDNDINPKAERRNGRDSDPPVVLYVSEDSAYLNEVRHGLGHAGFSVVAAKSPAEAMELAVESALDAMLSDYNLMQQDALTLFGEIKTKMGDTAPPSIVIADYDEAVLKSKCKNAGVAGFHAKTDSLEKLLERVVSVIRDPEKKERVALSVSRRQFKGGTDTLTRIANQEHFLRRLNGESMASYRDQSFLSLLMITVDRYSKLIDHYGKQRAENALAQIARLIESELRSRDCVARYGEYTFAVVLPDTHPQAAAAVARRLRHRLSTSEFGNIDQSVSLTVSVGVTTRHSGTRKSPKDMCDEAQRALDAAKKMGGDRVVADTALTGAPLILVVGNPMGDAGAAVQVLENNPGIEVRSVLSFNEACNMMGEVPVAMVIAEDAQIGSRSGVDFLVWVKERFPAILRLLVSDRVNSEVMVKAINEAAIHHFVQMPVALGKLSSIVEGLLFK